MEDRTDAEQIERSSHIHKKENSTNYENYRVISLLDVAYKVMVICIRDRIMNVANKVLGEFHAGFWNNRPTMDQILPCAK